jgi:hypothetical protein
LVDFVDKKFYTCAYFYAEFITINDHISLTSRHKRSIAAVVENFLVRKEAANIASDDLCELDTLISDLIARKKEKAVSSSNIFSNNYSNDSNSQVSE